MGRGSSDDYPINISRIREELYLRERALDEQGFDEQLLGEEIGLKIALDILEGRVVENADNWAEDLPRYRVSYAFKTHKEYVVDTTKEFHGFREIDSSNYCYECGNAISHENAGQDHSAGCVQGQMENSFYGFGTPTPDAVVSGPYLEMTDEAPEAAKRLNLAT
jgi:hypothetical protein